MDLDSFNQIINQGENISVEFKSSEVRKESLAKEICSFSNTSGGVILLGVSDNGEIKGLNQNFNYEEWAMNIGRDHVVPSVTPIYSQIEINSLQVGILEIPKGSNKPYQTIGNKFLLRVGSTNRVATQAELMRLFQQSGMFHYDLLPVENTTINSLNSSYLSDYFTKYNIDYTDESDDERKKLLINTDVLAEDGSCTVAGLLLFGLKPQKYLYNASISIARFKGNLVGDELLDKQVIEGTLSNQIDISTSIIKNYIPVASRIEGNKRIDITDTYSERTIREVLVNAVVHRNYSISGSRIRIFIFDNRVECISPGRLPNTITTEKIRYGVSYAVNPVLVKFMENLRYIDKLGRGIPMVCSDANKIGKKVEFLEIGEDFKVVLWL
ncbi:transcriptional regulator [Thiospirochaeta perfilievii]|uniref:Transcriptional regulator n=1 Tax=Thiospirochaeta perfilievii TaxID=252967 RepID=A0A5C1QDK5_9SPIO|nr:RNA-binding domain-containing protein [Thiospirochaeta perfilievii]QEN05661.1 transcriptional regulator [Thiospirochaeta perfilievii]